MIEDPLPRHEQISNQLKKEIVGEQFKPGDKLPSEKRLCDYFDVSRVTIRHALQTLENEGLIFRKQGLGAFVNERLVEKNLVRLTDFSEDMKQAGFESSSRLLALDKVKVPDDIADILDLARGINVIKIKRVRLASGKPIALDITWLPASYGQLLFDEDLTTQTIYEIFEEKYDISILAGRYKLTAVKASKEMAKYMNLKEGDALLEMDRCSRTTGDKKIYFQKRYYNPEMVSYELELARSKSQDANIGEQVQIKEFIPKFS